MTTSFDITFQCGHDGAVDVGSVRSSQRESRAAFIGRTRDCDDCQRADAARERADTNRANAEQATAEGLPTLTGSARQIEWAETIRREHLDWFASRRDGSVTPGTAATADLTALRSMTDARFWINHQGSPWKAHIRAQEMTA